MARKLIIDGKEIEADDNMRQGYLSHYGPRMRGLLEDQRGS
jgi:hypothetical protein